MAARGYFGTDSGAEIVDENFSKLFTRVTVRHKHTEVDRAKNIDVVERELGPIREGGSAACVKPLRAFPAQLSDLDRF